MKRGNRAAIYTFTIIFILSLLTFLPSASYGTKGNADFEMQVKGGYDGVARLGAYIPFNVLLINKGRALEGEIQLVVKISSDSRAVFAVPFSLPEGSTKEVIINAPVFTARRDVDVRVQEKGKTIKEMKYSFFKMIPPETKAIGVLSSDNAAYGFLNGMMLTMADKGQVYDERTKLMMAAGVYAVTASPVMPDGINTQKTESVLIPLKKETMPDDMRVIEGFDIIIISNFDTAALTGDQLEILEKWVREGGNLVIGTGVNWRKTYDGLPVALKKFTVTGSRSIEPPAEQVGLFSRGFSGDVKMDVVTGDLGFEYVKTTLYEGVEIEETKETNPETEKYRDMYGNYPYTVESVYRDEVITGDRELPLVVKYIHQQGCILFLAFDPGMEPLAGWEGRQDFWNDLLFHTMMDSNRFWQRQQGYYYPGTSQVNNWSYLTRQVPEDKSPPYLFMLITLVVYIIIIGPFLYIMLKKKDKRDLNWIAVPVLSFLCLIFIYIAGFKTRYQTAVLNAVSLIDMDMDAQKLSITTGMGVFNNKKGDLSLAYSKNSNIDFDLISNQDYYGYRSYADGSEPEGRITSKMLLTEPVVYELYDVAMWEPRYLSAIKTDTFDEKLINSVQIKDGRFKAIIKNPTRYEFIDAFMSIGSSFFGIGDIFPGQEIVVELDLNSKDVYNSMEAYIDSKYGPSYYQQGVKPPEDFPVKYRRRNIIQNLLYDKSYRIMGQAKIGLYALSNQDMGYNVEINGKQPEIYYTNGIFTSMDMNFEKNQEVEIPGGIVLPYLEENIRNGQQIAYLDGTDGVRVIQKGDVDFTFQLLNNIRYTDFQLGFETFVPLYVKYNFEDMMERDKDFNGQILKDTYEYYIYNAVSDEWEQIGENFAAGADSGKYIDKENRLRVRIKVVELASEGRTYKYDYYETEMLSLPKLQLKGVAD